MARPARFDEDAILDAALRVIADERRPATLSVDAIAAEMGGNVGSIYYRFPSKSHLLARLWIRCARRGQAGMIAALKGDDLARALTDAVLHYPRWSRQNLPAAQVLAAYGREQVIPEWPDDLAVELETVNNGLINAVHSFTRRWFGDTRRHHRQAATFALLDVPVAAIRRYLLAGRPPPRSLDAIIVAAASAALHDEQQEPPSTGSPGRGDSPACSHPDERGQALLNP